MSQRHKIDENVCIGYPNNDASAVSIGDAAVIRSGSVIYPHVKIGDHFQCGHNILIRSHVDMGNHVVIGTNSVLEGHIKIGSFIKIESNCFIPSHTIIGNRVFLGPNVVLTNDKYPLKNRDQYRPIGPTIGDNVTLCAGVIILPGITIGSGSFIAAGALVTKDVPPNSFVMGSPGVCQPLPEHLAEKNMALSWREYFA